MNAPALCATPDLRHPWQAAVPAGAELMALCQSLYPIARSLTGPGVRETLTLLEQAMQAGPGQPVPMSRDEVPTGTQVFDWQVPREWRVRQAWLRGPDGVRRADFAQHNLHLVGYSKPVHLEMPLAQLQPYLHSLPEHPDWIPYRTSYYNETWGFCLADAERRSLPDGQYEVCVDTTLEDGHLTLAEVLVPGASEREVLVCTHVCHPSLANDNLSGLAVATGLIRALRSRDNALSYRFLFVPATIGAIAWLARNAQARQRIDHALVLSNLGDAGDFHYKLSRPGDSRLDQSFAHLFATEPSLAGALTEDFSPYGYDERQFNSPGIGIAAGCIMRTPHGRYPQYHTSADDLAFLSPDALVQSLDLCLAAFDILEHDRAWLNLNPNCEPQLGKRGLYAPMGGDNDRRTHQLAMLWVLNFSDGDHGLLEIARRARMPFSRIRDAAQALQNAQLLRPADE